MKLFKLKLILGILVPALFISSCSSPRLDELTVRETALQKGIKAKTDNCELVWLLETYASWAEIDLYSLEPSEATNIASKLKNYTQDVLNLNKSDLNLGPEYFNDLGFVLEKISSTDLAARFLREIGRTYFPTCGYFSVDEAFEIPQEQESQSELKMDEEIVPDPETGVDISKLPSGKRNSNAYANGVEQANAFITTGGLTRAIYSDLGGLENSCKFILDTFMLLSGGASTRQQYADFLLGCSVVVKEWY